MATQDDIRIFVAVVSAGGFSASADTLRLTRSAISRRIDALEERLGVRLLERTTRRMRLTEAGEVFYEQCSQILTDIEAAERSILETFGAPRGTLRVNSAVMIGLRMVVPLLGPFLERYPDLRVSLDLSDAPVGRDVSGHDVFIRLGQVADDTLISSRIGHSRRVICAAPSYVARAGVPERPEDLERHACLLLSGLGSDHNEWVFEAAARRISVKARGPLVFNSGDAHYEALLAGLGIGRVTEVFAQADIATGRLVPLLTAYQASGAEPIHALYRGGRYVPIKVRAFVDYLRAQARGLQTGAAGPGPARTRAAAPETG